MAKPSRQCRKSIHACYGKKRLHFDAALNVLWMTLGTLALARAIQLPYKRRLKGEKASGSTYFRVCGVLLVSAALFPYISATDDILRVQHMDHRHRTEQGDSTRHKTSDEALRLFEIADAPIIGEIRRTAIVLLFFCLVPCLIVRATHFSLAFRNGRSPPAAPIPFAS